MDPIGLIADHALDAEWLRNYIAQSNELLPRKYAEGLASTIDALPTHATASTSASTLHEIDARLERLSSVGTIPWQRIAEYLLKSTSMLSVSEWVDRYVLYRKRDLAQYVYSSPSSGASDPKDIDSFFSYLQASIQYDRGILRGIFCHYAEPSQLPLAVLESRIADLLLNIYKDLTAAALTDIARSREQKDPVLVNLCSRVLDMEEHLFGNLEDVCSDVLQTFARSCKARVLKMLEHSFPISAAEDITIMMRSLTETFPKHLVKRSTILSVVLEDSLTALVEKFEVHVGQVKSNAMQLVAPLSHVYIVLGALERLNDQSALMERNYALHSASSLVLLGRVHSLVDAVVTDVYSIHQLFFRTVVFSSLESAHWQDRFPYLQNAKPHPAAAMWQIQVHRMKSEVEMHVQSASFRSFSNRVVAQSASSLMSLYAQIRPSTARQSSLRLDFTRALLPILLQELPSVVEDVKELHVEFMRFVAELALLVAPLEDLFPVWTGREEAQTLMETLATPARFHSWIASLLRLDDAARWKPFISFSVQYLPHERSEVLVLSRPDWTPGTSSPTHATETVS